MFDSDSVTQENNHETYCADQDHSWQLPQFKAPLLINTACTVQCDTQEIVSIYKLSSNCDKLVSPLVNPEIWNDIAKRAQAYDEFLRDIQTLLAMGIIPIIKLSELLKSHISKKMFKQKQ